MNVDPSPARSDRANDAAGRLDDERAPARRERGHEETWDPCDPYARHAAHLAPPLVAPSAAAASAEAASAARAAVSLEELMPALLKRIAWTGDRQRGTVRMEIGAGALAGVTLTVHAEHGRVRVEIDAAAQAEVATLRARLGQRLRAQGIDVESIT